MSTIGCVILNYNDSKNIIELVHQIEVYSSIDHIIVVDNVSTDNSMECLNCLASEKVSIYSSLKNGGYGYGNNFGIRIAREKYGCDYVFIASPDVRFEENAVIEILKCFENNSKCKAATAMQFLPNGKLYRQTAWYLPTTATYIFSALYIPRKILRLAIKLVDLSEAKDDVVFAECITGAFICVDAKAFLSVGGFDENIFLYGEENALGFRFKAAGFVMGVTTKARYYHYHGMGSTYLNIKNNIERKKMHMNSRLYLLKTYLHASGSAMIFAKLYFKIALFEEYVKTIIKKIAIKQTV